MKVLIVPIVQKLAEVLFSDLSLNDVGHWLLNANVTTLVLIGTPVALLLAWLCITYIPHNRVGVIEKIWSKSGSLTQGRIIALNREAGYQAKLLRGGLHFGYWRWQYRIHQTPLVTIPQNEMGYVYARDGESLAPGQTLARVVHCHNFQDATAFLDPSGVVTSTSQAVELGSDGQMAVVTRAEHNSPHGQRGRQRAILREGTYAINPALFVVITAREVFALPRLQETAERISASEWQDELRGVNGFLPIVIGRHRTAADAASSAGTSPEDHIGIVTVHDGSSLKPGELIAPTVGSHAPTESSNVGPNVVQLSQEHNNFQDPEAFLAAGGRRGRQHQTLTDGTYFINRWFATVEIAPKTVVPNGHVGVVLSNYASTGRDLSVDGLRHDQQAGDGERGIWKRPLDPGKYAFNTDSGNIVLVPTTSFVLHWVTGRTESHQLDESLHGIELLTRDAYEPSLPLSIVVRIDCQRAPDVIRRFGDVKRLICQILDPLVSPYFQDVASKKTMLELLHDRDSIQQEARLELRQRFHEFDIECVDVLIGKPETAKADAHMESLLEQLRLRQLVIEQHETNAMQRAVSDTLRPLNAERPLSEMRTSMTVAKTEVQCVDAPMPQRKTSSYENPRPVALAFDARKSERLAPDDQIAKQV